jgi:hypothetical protein
VFKHYRRGVEPETSVYAAIRLLHNDHSPKLIETGRFDERAYEVWEYLPCGSLAEIPPEVRSEPAFVRQTVKELGQALAALEAVGVRHRNMKPASVMVRTREPLDLVLSDFATAVLAELDLQLSSVSQTTRYAAPETFVGTFASSSDWWSLGVIILEMLTGGRCFEGVHDKAFFLHLITRGIHVPAELPTEWRELLMGLLTRDPSKRWKWAEVDRWLNGERGIPNGYVPDSTTTGGGPALRLGQVAYNNPEAFALAAADDGLWNEGKDCLLIGAIATWLTELRVEPRRIAEIKRIAGDRSLDADAQFALALLVLNPNLPLCHRGEIVNPPWLLSNPTQAISWLKSALPSHLKRLDREAWLVRLRERADRVRSRVAEYSIPVVEEQLEVALLATSTSALEARWREKRRRFPESSHAALSVLYDRKTPSDEEYIILISAGLEALRAAEEIVQEAEQLAREAGVSEFTAEAAAKWFDFSRRDIFDALDERLRSFTRCGRERADDWADAFRLERRLSLPRALVLLAIPHDQWREPPKQQYVKNVVDFFRRKIVLNLQRGPLVRLLVNRTAARLDLCELGTPTRSAADLLDVVIQRSGHRVQIDPEALLSEAGREQRLRRLLQSATTYLRETGIHSLYMGFPILLLRDERLSEGAKPRIAPILLWPVGIDTSTGVRGEASIRFDRERQEVRLNPALEALVGSERFGQLREAADEVLARDHLRMTDVINVFATLFSVESSNLQAMPPADFKMKMGETRLRCSAALFLSDFSGQTIAEDLKQIANRPIQGTAMEAAIRVGAAAVPAEMQVISELQQYFTTEADPSQKIAVFHARSDPGLVIQGPPGTGKSQTIVNIISDCIGRGERVLVVCQKQAALEVVKKRLLAEKLGSRLFLVEDAVSDRRPVLEALREQVLAPANGSTPSASPIKTERESVAKSIEVIETALNQNHESLHRRDAECGYSYREILAQLIDVEKGTTVPVSVPGLRPILKTMDHTGIQSLVDRCAPLAGLWLAAGYENSPLHAVGAIGIDAAAIQEFTQAFNLLVQAEIERAEILKRHNKYFEINDGEPLRQWLAANQQDLQAVSDADCRNVSRWFELLCPENQAEQSPATELLTQLSGCATRLRTLPPTDFNSDISPQLAELQESEVQRWVSYASDALSARGAWANLNPVRLYRWRRLRKFLSRFGIGCEAATIGAFRKAAHLELSVRPERQLAGQIRTRLLEKPVPLVGLGDLREEITRLIAEITRSAAIAERVASCPTPEKKFEPDKCATAADYSSWIAQCHASLAVFDAKRRSLAALERISHWMKPSWGQDSFERIGKHNADIDNVTSIAKVISKLPAFLQFRIRSQGLDELAFRAFATLRTLEDVWSRVPADQLGTEVRRSLWREALLSWKDRIESQSPHLLIDRAEIEEKVKALADLDASMRQLNRKLLSNWDPSKVGSAAEWQSITRFQGARALRLREVNDRGESLGLFELRPVWLCSPEMVSRLFALRAGMFDVVIFDEASQLPVEGALPAMFRGKRLIVSGDEKQLPPSSFFNIRYESDEEDFDDDWLESDSGEMDAATLHRREELLNRREVKDCDDLLALAQTVLPTATLNIHYRSKYRQLIDFSNCAFYGNRLSVPARHPNSEIQRVRPIELVRIDSPYINQTNPEEAQRVVDLVQEIWVDKRKFQCPSVGVVTFNLKQAELILEKIEERATENAKFCRVLEEERRRTQDGEDMRFFVKNLETVQGDERDWIIFSTTFGRDAQGGFRRNFGVLGQSGGERRLNVAVTRAREKIIIVTSLPTAQVSTFIGSQRRPHFARDFLQAYLDYSEKLSNGQFEVVEALLANFAENGKPLERTNGRHQDQFSREVESFLQDHGYTPIPVVDGDAFSLDFAVADPRTGLFGIGIECDPPRHPLLATARARELWRPTVLKAAIPQIHRVWSRLWYHDRAEEQRRLLTAVQKALGG